MQSSKTKLPRGPAMHRIGRRQLLIAAGLGATGLARAQAWPARPVAVVTNSAPGGQGDLVARTLAEAFKARLGGSFTVDNRPGANSTIATNYGARAAPDGYTLLTTGVGSQLPVFSKNNSVDVSKSMIPVGGIYSASGFIWVRSSLGVNTLAELVAYSQKNDLKMGVANATSELAMAMLESRFPKSNPLKYRVIPYRSDVAIVTALLGGEVDFSFSSPGAFLGHLAAGTLKPVMSAGPTRVPPFTDVPTATELGFKDYVVRYEIGLWVPNGTPPEIVRKLDAELTTMTTSKEFTDRMRAAGNDTYVATGEQFLQDYRTRNRFWEEAAKLAGYEAK